jgi:myo-inositol-1(or 4)-monophosphatase
MPHDPLLLATAIEAVLRAGDIQMKSFGATLKVDKKGVIDLVTNVDFEVERLFRETIATRFPDHQILAEEFHATSPSGGRDGFWWIFDPLDGTTNYAHGLPIFSASAALELDGQPIAGAVYDPTRRELFTAERGGGARLNGEAIRVSPAAVLVDSLLGTGFPYDVHESSEAILGLFGEFVTRARAVRRLGSAALDLCYVAAGRFDGFWEQRLQAWDTAAGALIVEEAGGRVSGLSGEPFDSRRGALVASNGAIHEEMLQAIRDFILRSPNRTE